MGNGSTEYLNHSKSYSRDENDKIRWDDLYLKPGQIQQKH